MIANEDHIIEKRSHPENFDQNTGIFCSVCYPELGKFIPVDNVKDPYCPSCSRKLTQQELEYGNSIPE